jgi:pimeloyl-ACP methyl ester carboxylesterase
MAPRLILFPGLHGTADLFAPLLEAIPRTFARRAISYPSDAILPYTDLIHFLEDTLRDEASVVLIAESFSGPLAIRFAAAHSGRVQALVLCASFVRLPRPPWHRRLLAPILFRLPPLAPALRHFLAGSDASPAMMQLLQPSLRQGKPNVLLARLHEAFRVNVSADLARCSMPLLYLSGTADRLMPRAAIDPILAIRPDTIVRTIDGPHMLLQTRPVESWQAIETFLKNHLADFTAQPFSA